MSNTAHMVLGPHYPELDCAEMIGTSSIGGCSLVDGPEDEYLEGLKLKLTDDENDVGNGHRRRCRITDETDVNSWSESSLQEPMLPRRAPSPCLHFRKDHFDSSPVVALRIEPVINLSLSPLPRHVSKAVRELSQLDDANLSTTTTALKVAGTVLRAGWIDSLAIKTDPTAGNVDVDTLFSELPELVCNAPHTEQEQQAHKQLLVQLGDEWRQATAEGGAVYYFNRRTRESQWNLPEGIIRLKVVSQGGKESNGQGDDNEQRLCSISELDTGVHQTTSPLEYSEIRRRSCDASAITEVEGMDEVGVEFVGQITAKKPTYNGGLLVNPLLLSNEELSPLAHERLIQDECKPLGNLLLNTQHPINKLSFQPDLQESIANNSSDRGEKNAVVTAYVDSGSSGDNSETWPEAFPETASDVGQGIYKDGLDDNKADVDGDDCAEFPYPQTYETAGNGRFAVNHSLTSSPNIHSQVQFVEPVGDFKSIPSRMGEATPNSGLNAETKCKDMDKMGVKVGDQKELLTALFCPYCGACLDPHLLASHLTVCHYSSNACMQKLVELALLPREIALINSTVDEHPRQNDCEKDGFKVTNLPEKSTEQFNDVIDIEQLSNVERCPECNRTFARGRMSVHAKVCHRVFGEKRPIFNDRLKRYQGMPMEFTNTTSAYVGSSLSKSKSRSKPSSTRVSTNYTLRSADKSSQSLQQHQHSTSSIKLDEYCGLTLDRKKISSIHRQREQYLYHQTQISYRSSSSQDHEQQLQNSVKGERVSINGLCTLCPFCKSSIERKNLSLHFLKCKQLKETRRARSSNLTSRPQCTVERNASNVHDPYCGRKFRKSGIENHRKMCENAQNRPKNVKKKSFFFLEK